MKNTMRTTTATTKKRRDLEMTSSRYATRHLKIICNGVQKGFYSVPMYFFVRNKKKEKIMVIQVLMVEMLIKYSKCLILFIYRIGSIWAPLLITTPPHENVNRTPVKNEYWNNRTPSRIEPHPYELLILQLLENN